MRYGLNDERSRIVLLYLFVGLAVVFSVLRFLGHTNQTFQAFVHLYVGGLVGGWITTRRGELLWLAVGLTVVEIVAFALVRMGVI